MVGDIPLFASGRHQVQPRLENYGFLTTRALRQESVIYAALDRGILEGFLTLRAKAHFNTQVDSITLGAWVQLRGTMIL
jgi:hypothetical protein